MRAAFAAQMRQALKHIKATLEYADSGVDRIAKANIYLDRRADCDEMKFFGRDPSSWPAKRDGRLCSSEAVTALLTTQA